MKKLKLFLFSIGVGTAFAFAHADDNLPCSYYCDVNYNTCGEGGLSAGACSKLYDMCNEACRAGGE